MLRGVVFALALALPAAAQEGPDRVSPEEFEALSTGRTLYFRHGDDGPAGAEQYLPGRRAIWRTAEGTCLRGVWAEAGQDICFAYEDAPGFWQCWEVWRDDDGLFARPSGEGPEAAVLRVSGMSERPLDCPEAPPTS